VSLSHEQKAAFQKDGVIPIGLVLTNAELDEARTRFDRLFQERVGTSNRGLRNISANSNDPEEQKHSKQRHYQFYNIWEHDEWYKSLLYKKELLDIVESVLGPHIQLLHDQVFYKPAKDGSPTQWHQDNAYWNYTPPNLASIWIALDDVDLENACLHFVPGSQGAVVPPKSILLPSGVMVYEVEVNERDLRPFPMPAGHALMHHCLTIHGAYPNRSDRGRRALGIHYMQAGVKNGEGKAVDNLKKHPLLRGGMR
jgi:ectoine hydroxylase-related dioxygenase (phytanoyl-CoA dioxygenase family)